MTLAEYLKQNAITLTAFAASIGENIPTVHGWISGRRNPKLAALVAIERATDGAVRAADFLPMIPQSVAKDAPKPKRSAATKDAPPAKPKCRPAANTSSASAEAA
jgi:DNA-binding transcriptional regulator YdaS (Cro superfamily)